MCFKGKLKFWVTDKDCLEKIHVITVCNRSLVLYVDDQQYDYSNNVFIVNTVTLTMFNTLIS